MTHGNNGVYLNFYTIILLLLYFLCIWLLVYYIKIYNNNKIMVKKIKINK